MNMNFVKMSAVIMASLGSFHVFATDSIQITVIAMDKAAAVGYLVDGKRIGGLGKTYSGHGPMNKKYSFGYRKRVFGGTDISCGSLVLNKDSKVKLVIKGEQCYSVIN